MVLRRLSLALCVAVSGSAVALAAASCSSFGEAGTAPAPATDGAAEAASTDANGEPSRGDGGARTCQTPVVLDFESDYAAQGFKAFTSATAAVAIVPGSGTNGGGALESSMASADPGKYAEIGRDFPITTAGLELELSFDYTVPNAANLYVSDGCTLSFRTSTTSNKPATNIGPAWVGLSGPHLQSGGILAGGESSPPSAGDRDLNETAFLGFHHISVVVAVADDGTTAHATYTNNVGAVGTLDFALVEKPTVLHLACGLYADSAAVSVHSYVDNVRFTICNTK